MLIADLANRHDLYEKAEKAARSFWHRHPMHPLVRDTLHYLHACVAEKRTGANP